MIVNDCICMDESLGMASKSNTSYIYVFAVDVFLTISLYIGEHWDGNRTRKPLAYRVSWVIYTFCYLK